MSFLYLLLVVTAAVEEPRVPAAITTREGLDLVVATGPIDAGFSERLRFALDSNAAARVLEVESLGGLSDQAYKAAQLLNDRSIKVRVRGRCASACALMWASSNNRVLVEGARIGLHSSRTEREPPRLLRGAVQRYSSRLAEAALSNAGFSDELIKRALNTPPDSMLWLDVEAVGDAGAVFEYLPRGRPQAYRTAPNNSVGSFPSTRGA